jgi:hypothetical protein
MNIATVLKVFKNSSLITEQGEFSISKVFRSTKTALNAGFRFYGRYNGIALYARRQKEGKLLFAAVNY